MSVLDETTLKDKKMNDISVGIASIDDCGGGGGTTSTYTCYNLQKPFN